MKKAVTMVDCLAAMKAKSWAMKKAVRMVGCLAALKV